MDLGAGIGWERKVRRRWSVANTGDGRQRRKKGCSWCSVAEIRMKLGYGFE